MSFSWKRWVKNLGVRKLPTQVQYAKRFPRVLEGAELLEDRIVPSVTVSDLTERWLPVLRDNLDDAVNVVGALGQVVDIFDSDLRLKYIDNLQAQLVQAKTVADAAITAGSFDPNAALDAAPSGFLMQLNSLTGGVLTVVGTPDITGTKAAFTLDIRPGAGANDQLTASILEKTGLSALTGGSAVFDLVNKTYIRVNVIIDETGFAANTTDPNTLQFGSGTQLVYSPTLAVPTQSISGKLGVGGAAINYGGSVAINLPQFTLSFGSGGTLASLTSLTPSVSTPIAPLTATLSATLQAGAGLPALTVEQKADFNFETGVGSFPEAKFLVDGQDIETASGRRELALQILGDRVKAAFNLLEPIPEQIADLLLGTFPVAGSLTLNDLLGGLKPIDALKPFITPAAVDVITNILRARQFVAELNSPSDNTAKKADDLGVYYLGSTQRRTTEGVVTVNPVAEVLKLFKGQPVDLVEWRVDVRQLDEVKQALAAGALKEQLLDNSAGGKTNYIVAHFDSGELIQKVKDGLLGGLSGDTRRAAEYIFNFVLQNALGGINLSIDARIAAAVALGVDSSFLQGGTLADSLYVSAGNLIDFGLDAKIRYCPSFALLPG